MVGAVIVGAGEGKRMGATARKQFVKIAGRPIIAYTLDVFEHTPLVDYVVIVVPRDAIEWVRDEIVSEYGYKKVHAIVYGGASRQESVLNGLKALKPGTQKVLIHDAVRPLVSDTLIRRVIDASQKTGAAITAVPAKETVKRVESGDIVGTLDRGPLWLAQTPQCFNYDIIMNAHAKAQSQNVEGTDDAALVEATGVKVAVAVGSYSNLKMTSPEELPMFEYFLGQEVKARIDAGVEQGERVGRGRHRRRRPRRRRGGELVGEAREPGHEREHAREGERGHERGHGKERTRMHGRGHRRERGREQVREQAHGRQGEQPREQPRDRRREHQRVGTAEHGLNRPPRDFTQERQRDHAREPRLAEDRDGVRHT